MNIYIGIESVASDYGDGDSLL